jgi:GLPGLI family protein
MIVAGKKCRKANYIDTRFHPTLKKELTQVTEVWFLEEIKIPCGPLNYNGLPGAIVRIRIPGLGVIQAESIKITENKFKAKQFPKLRNIISDNELRKKFNKK